MLRTLERQVTATVSKALEARAGLTVVLAPAPAGAIPAGQRRIVVALREVTVDPAFPHDEVIQTQKTPALLRRVVPLQFVLDLRLRARPADGVADGASSSRDLLLEDAALAIHALHDFPIRSGAKLVPAGGDPGFEVSAFTLASGKVNPEIADGLVAADLQYNGMASIWPPAKTEKADEILTIDIITAAQPIRTAAPTRLAANSTTRIRVQSIDGKRLPKKGDPREPLRLAVRVVSDLPPAARGKIAGADANGLSLVAVNAKTMEAFIDYTAPATAQVEIVTIHLATPDGTPGLLLGSVPITVEKP